METRRRIPPERSAANRSTIHFHEFQNFMNARVDLFFVLAFFIQAVGNIFRNGKRIEQRLPGDKTDVLAKVEQFCLR